MFSVSKLPVIIIFGMVVLALLRELAFFPVPDLIPNPDTSWLIYAAQRVEQGQKLYVDIMETNPPLIVWISLLPVIIGKIFSINPLLVFPVLVTVLNVAVLWMMVSIMRGHKFFAGNPLFQSILIYIGGAFFLLSAAIYGQRELLFITLVLPYLFLSFSAPVKRDKLGVSAILMAAVGFAIKPFFLLLWGVNELAVAIERKKLTAIFAWHNWVIAMVQLVYFASVYYFLPEYYTNVIPTILETYFTFESTWDVIIKTIFSVAGLTVFLVLFAGTHGEYKKIILRVLLWLFACSAFIMLQRKEWPNHIYPMAFMAGLALVLAALYLVELWRDLGTLIGYRKFTALCLIFAAIGVACYIEAKFWVFIYKNKSVISNKLITEINKNAAGKNVYPLVFSLQPSFPAIALSQGVFRGSFHHLWPMSGIIIREQEEYSTDRNSKLAEARRFFYDSLVHDFSSNPPELVWVDENVNMEEISGHVIHPYNRDIISVLSRDVRFFVLWQNYEKIGEITGEEPKKLTEEELQKGRKQLKPERFSLYIRKKI